MKKLFLFVAAVVALSLASCSGGDASNASDNQSLDPGIDPNVPSAQPPQVSNASPTVEENVASTPSATGTSAVKEEQKAPADANKAENPEATNIDPNA